MTFFDFSLPFLIVSIFPFYFISLPSILFTILQLEMGFTSPHLYACCSVSKQISIYCCEALQPSTPYQNLWLCQNVKPYSSTIRQGFDEVEVVLSTSVFLEFWGLKDQTTSFCSHFIRFSESLRFQWRPTNDKILRQYGIPEESSQWTPSTRAQLSLMEYFRKTSKSIPESCNVLSSHSLFLS